MIKDKWQMYDFILTKPEGTFGIHYVHYCSRFDSNAFKKIYSSGYNKLR